MPGVDSLTHLSPGAQTCVVVGAIDADEVDLGRYRGVLWFTRQPTPAGGPPGIDPGRVRIEPVPHHDPDRTIAALDDLIRRDTLHLPAVIVAEDVRSESGGCYRPVIALIAAQFESHQRARTTRPENGFRRQSHVLANLAAYAHRRVPPRWAGALAGQAAIVCGAGPSLDASLPGLKHLADRAVIFAADSTLRALARVGVTADFAVSVDACTSPEHCLTPGHASAGRVILGSGSPSDWQYSVSEHKLHFLSGRQLTEDRLAEAGVPKTQITVEENAGITALALALHFGCGPIYLLGLDHAVDGRPPLKRPHRPNLVEAARQIDFSFDNHCTREPGNHHPEAPILRNREWQALDSKCAESPAGILFNVTDRGARLRNTTVIHPSSWLIPEPDRAKEAPLSMLATPDSVCERDWRMARTTITAAATQAAEWVAQARAAFEAGQIQRGAELLARPFRDQRCHLVFGHYRRRIVPHLVRFNEVDAELWPQLLDESSELVTLALNLR